MLNFDATPLSPIATSFADLAHWRKLSSGVTPLALSTNANGDIEINAAPGVMTLASSRAALHAGSEGDWHYFSPDNALIKVDNRFQGEWTAAVDAGEALSLGLEEVVKFFLNYATRLLDSLDAIDGEIIHDRLRSTTGEFTISANTYEVQAAAALDAFKWIADSDVEAVTLSGFSNSANNAGFFVESVDTSADPHVLTLDSESVLFDETASEAIIKYHYQPGLSLPRKGLRKGSSELPNTTIPKAFKDATCVLARYLMNKDLFKAAANRKGVTNIKLDTLEVGFIDESDYLLGQDVKSYLPDEVLQLIEFALKSDIRGYGARDVTGGEPVTFLQQVRIS